MNYLSHVLLCARILASMSPKATRSAARTASSSSVRISDSWQAMEDKVIRLQQLFIMDVDLNFIVAISYVKIGVD
ncbi:MAG TPA: hypothetical protein VJY54_13250 [Lachnospiraceae bacterium]|nr:hypothetical protein [Lachnospiraceae bacterium]